VLALRDDERSHRIINEEVDTGPVIDQPAGFTIAGEKPAVIVEEEKFITPEMEAPKAAAPKATPKGKPAEAPKAAPIIDVQPEVINPDEGLASFDDDLEAELNALLKPKAA
jgi:hypothetical protein